MLKAVALLGLLPMLALADCPDGSQGQLAIIIDDLGYHRGRGMRLAALPQTITLSVIPGTPHAKQVAEEGIRQGKEIMIHMPMSPAHAPVDYSLALHKNLSATDFDATVERALVEIPQATGMNNHMGSRLTEDRIAMRRLMTVLKDKQLFWIDSRTTRKTVAVETAATMGIPAASRSVFLDNDRDPPAIARHLLRAINFAKSTGSAIAIGHPHPETIQALQDYLPTLSAAVTLVPASTIARCPPTQRLTSIP